MGRLQDFPSVTPTSSDKILIVQSQGQGLAPHTIKLDSANPTGTGSLSLNRKSGTTVGVNSVATGYNPTVSGVNSSGFGETVVASGNDAQAMGLGTIANHLCQHSFGAFNVADTSTAASTARGNYIEIVGKGTSDGTRSNARTLDWSGNETLAGDLTFNGNISLNTLTTLLRGMTAFRIDGGASKTVTVIADGNSNFSFLVVGIGRNADINPILMHIGGYVTASRSFITNITGKTGLTVDNSSTTNMNFVFTNTVPSVELYIRLIPLFENSFTVT